jgi:hypothetical protein
MITGWPFPFFKSEKSPFLHASIGTVAVPVEAFRFRSLCSLKNQNVLFLPL